ncbi:MAG: MTAP family purine nucleoside phosphorylase [Nitrospinota bacterium]
MNKNLLGVIGGSGAYTLLKEEAFGPDLECKKIITPFGESGVIHRFVYNDADLLFLSRHGDDGYLTSAPFVNYRANIWGLKECGVERIISWSGPGIINNTYSVGEFVLPHDMIDETKGRDYTFFEKEGMGFIRQGMVFCQEIRDVSGLTLNKMGIKHHDSGVYVCTHGPRLETPAEIKKYGMLGGDVVGMTLVPEAFLAKELEMCYAPICYLTNYAEGVVERPLRGDDIFGGMQNHEEKERVNDTVMLFPVIIQDVLNRLKGVERGCICKNSMLRYKKERGIGEDWHKWIKPPD